MSENEIHSFIDKRIEPLGYRVVRVKFFNQSRILQVMIDFKDSPDQSSRNHHNKRIGSGDCEVVSDAISLPLSIEGMVKDNCAVEVSTPGLDRPLVQLEDFVQHKGHKVQLALKNTINGVKKCKATVVDVINTAIAFELYNSERLQVELGDIDTVTLSLDHIDLFKSHKQTTSEPNKSQPNL